MKQRSFFIMKLPFGAKVHKVFRVAPLAVLGCCAGSAYAASASTYPLALETYLGQQSDQPISVLQQQELTGTTDKWDAYIELYGSKQEYRGVFTFQLPAGVDRDAVTALRLDVNYRGPTRKEQRWVWKARDFKKRDWAFVGDNAAALDWVWAPLSFVVGGNLKDYITSTGAIRIQYSSRTRLDNSDLDYVALVVTHDKAPPDSGDPPEPTGRIWHPLPGKRWQVQLQGSIDTSVDAQIFDLDLFDTPQATIDKLHAAGRAVVCYFSAGSWEDWRGDAARFDAPVLGRSNGWPGEKWLDIRRLDVLGPIMQDRLDLAVRKGCDGVDPDNVDGYTNHTGFPLTYADQLAYNRWLANEAHLRGLSVGLKNDLEQIEDLVGDFDWAINEQCFEYNECDLLTPFVRAGKAVFHIEYSKDPAAFCPRANEMGLDSVKKTVDLDAWRIDCKDY
jgi:hypothetical protein